MALALDATSNGSVSGTSSTLTIAHTCAVGASLYVCVAGLNGINTVSGVTYAGAALTKVSSSTSVNAFRTCEIWAIDNPASGANNIVITSSLGSASTYLSGFGVSFTGAATVSLGAVANEATASANSISKAITTTRPNSFLVTCYYYESTGAITISGTETQNGQINDATGGYSGASSRWQVASPGSNTPSASGAAASQWRMCIAEVLPPVSFIPKIIIT